MRLNFDLFRIFQRAFQSFVEKIYGKLSELLGIDFHGGKRRRQVGCKICFSGISQNRNILRDS